MLEHYFVLLWSIVLRGEKREKYKLLQLTKNKTILLTFAEKKKKQHPNLVNRREDFRQEATWTTLKNSKEKI